MKEDEMGGAYSTHGRDEKCIHLIGKPEGKRSHGRPRRRWEDDIRMDLKETEREYVHWTLLDQDRDQWRALINIVMNLRIP
jgi:hypothetical protein